MLYELFVHNCPQNLPLFRDYGNIERWGQEKSLFEYDNYRVYLKDFYESSKAENSHFSLRFFSRLAGFKSQSVLTQVIKGERNISLQSINKFIKALKLSKREGIFFKNLFY